MSTLHNMADISQIAETVLMPGDPRRAEYVAKNYLENAQLVNDIRCAYAYTGTYHGKKVTVMASGMGMPSIGIYSYELFRFYNVENIIRIGSCGTFVKDLHMKDMIIAMGACTDSNYAQQYRLPGTFAPIADFGLVRKAAELCEKKGLNYRVGNILSSDVFYDDADSALEWAKMGVLGVEMESCALYCNAARAGKKALCICSVTDSFVSDEEKLTPEERQNALHNMIEVGLEMA